MRTEHDRHITEPGPPELTREGERLGTALAQGLDRPLSALRASMESLSTRLAPDLAAHGLMSDALKEVERLGRNVRDLMDYVCPPAPMPLRCTASEIAMSAVAGIDAESRLRVLVAREHAEETICADAPLLADAVRRLTENALEAGSSEVLIIARSHLDGTRVSFRVVDGCQFCFDSGWARSAFHSTKRNHLGLGLALIERDLDLMNGTLDLRHSPTGGTVATLTVLLPAPASPEAKR